MINVNKTNVIAGLQKLANYDYQKKVWLSSVWPWSSLDEDYCQAFDDTGLTDAMKANQPVFGKTADQVLREVRDAAEKVQTQRPPKEVLNDPLMQVVRRKAAEALQLIQQNAA